MKNESLRKKMQCLRAKADLKQEEVAQKVGISLMSYRRYEYGERLPDVKTAIRIADALGVADVRTLWSIE